MISNHFEYFTSKDIYYENQLERRHAKGKYIYLSLSGVRIKSYTACPDFVEIEVHFDV